MKGYAPSKNDFLFERRLNDYLFDTINAHSKGRPSLVFCSSRKGTSEAAAHLAAQAKGHPAAGRFGSLYVKDAGAR